MEFLDIVDENGNPTGEIQERAVVHKMGLRHRTSHVWILRRKNGRVQVLLQKRGLQKESFPGCYDISSAGHIPAGMDFLTSALRELDEELGIKAQPKELIFCGQRKFYTEAQFHGKPFKDCQVSNIYVLWKDIQTDEIRIQKEELESVLWMDYQECCEKVKHNSFLHSIVPEELELLKSQM